MEKNRKIRLFTGYIVAILAGAFFSNSLFMTSVIVISVLAVFCIPEVIAIIGGFLVLLNYNSIALKLTNLGLLLDKSEPYCLITKSGALVNLRRYSEAESVASLALNSNLIEPLQNVWAAKYSMGKAHEAFECANKIIERKPKFWVGYYARAVTCCFLSVNKHHVQMLDDANKVVEMNPKSPYGYCGRSAVYSSMSKPDESLENALKAVKYAPHQIDFKIGLIAAYLDKYELAKCIDILNKFANKKPLHEMAVYYRALIFIQQNMYDAAMRDINDLSESELNKPALIYIHGLALCSTNQLYAAFDNANKLIKGLPESTMGYQLRAFVYLSLGRLDDAMRELITCKNLNKFSSSVYDSVAQVYFEQGNFEEAIETCSESLSLNKYSCMAARIKSLSYLALNMMPQAEEWNGYADNIFSDNSMAWYCYGCIAFKKKDFAAALEHFDRAIEMDAYNPNYYMKRAMVFEQHNQLEKAEQDRNKFNMLKVHIEAEGTTIT